MTMLRRLVWASCTAAVAWALAGTAAAAAQNRTQASDAPDPRSSEVAFRIDAQPIDGALREFASQANLQLIYETTEVSPEIRSPHVAGAFTPEAALSRLLAHTNLNYKFINNRTVSIRSNEDASRSRIGPSTDLAPRDAQSRLASSEPANPGSTGRSSSTDAAIAYDSRSGARRKEMDEIVVTAQKREERLLDVPASVTAISGDALVGSNQLRLQDYYTSVPGLNLVSNGSGSNTLSIRGITTGGQASPTVGIVVDDAPFGVSTALTYRVSAPDIDPAELARVEVLSGPQGTLYGASSIGGLIKFVTTEPSTDSIKGHVDVSTSSVHNGSDLGYGVRGSVNVPVSETVALRASAFTRRDPGYVDGLYLGAPPLKVDGLNQTDVHGGRLSGLWKMADDWTLKLSALLQDTDARGTANVTLPAVGSLAQQLYVRGAHDYTDRLRSYTGTLTGTLYGVKLVSITGYNTARFNQILDLTAYPGLSGEATSLYGVSGAQVAEQRITDKLTEEVRASGSFAKQVDWLVGLFYTHERTPTHDIYQAVDPTSLSVAGLIYDDPYPTTYAEYAVFSDITFHVTDRFDIQLGGRESQNRQTYTETLAGPAIPDFYGLDSPLINPPVHTKDNAFTYLVTPRFKFSENLMAYARVASGYRPGGPNPTCTLFAIPCHFQPDKTTNYELGVKSELLSHRLSLIASVYYIDWKDIQLQVYNEAQTASFFTNASTAKSQGLELAVRARPINNLKLAAWVAWNDAQLTADMPPGGALAGNSGDPLPYSSRFSGNFSFEQEIPLMSNVSAFAGAEVSYIGRRKSDFTAAPSLSRLELPSYVLANLRTGLHLNSWDCTLFLNNVSDERGAISGGTVPQTSVVYIQPRTVGLSIAKTF